MGRLTLLAMRWHPVSFDLQGAFLTGVVRKDSLTSRVRKMWSLIWTVFSFSSSSSWSICPQETNSGCWAWGPSVSCLMRSSGFSLYKEISSSWPRSCSSSATRRQEYRRRCPKPLSSSSVHLLFHSHWMQCHGRQGTQSSWRRQDTQPYFPGASVYLNSLLKT